MKLAIFESESNRPEAQLILLSGLIIMMGTVTFMVLLNNLILTANLPAAGLDISKQDIKEFRNLVISEVNYATTATLQYSQENETTNETLLRNHFLNYTDDLRLAVSRVYATRGSAVDIVVNNVTFTSTITNRTITVQHFRPQSHFFPDLSLIIPMDEHQNNTLQVYGLVWNIVNNTQVPVYEVMQNPVNMTNISSNPPNMTGMSYEDFYLNVTTDDIFLLSDGPGTVTNRTYSGGAFLIDYRDLNSSLLQWIFDESTSFAPNITIHGLRQENGTTLPKTIVMTDVPSVAIYNTTEPYPLADYYSDMQIPFTLVDDDDILNNLTLKNYSVLVLQNNMSDAPLDVIKKITNWTADGGVLFAEGEGAISMDTIVEYIDNNTLHPWYGFIGITQCTNLSDVTPVGPSIKLINGSSILDETPPMPLAGLANPGASFNPLSQTTNIHGMYGPSSKGAMAFLLNTTAQAVNPGTNIIGYAAFPNGSQILYDDDGDGEDDYYLAYMEAPFENGRVIYIAGEDLRERGEQAERIAAAIFYASVSREELALEANNINMTVSYSDGRADYSDTFLITI